METPKNQTQRGLRIHDMVGLVVGYSLAALMARSFWPASMPLSGTPLVCLSLGVLWLGLAMSGPILLLLDRRGTASGPSPEKHQRPGRLIGSVEPIDRTVGRRPVEPRSIEPPRYTRAELAWIVIGGYWIAMTIFVVPALSYDTPWAIVGLIQVVAALGLLSFVPGRSESSTTALAWTHSAATILLWTWPVAWVCMILLSRHI